VQLIRLSLLNFKGCRSFTFEPNGNNASVYGDNATFKTTQCDAFSWLLFGKDSAGKADFEIKTLGPDGEPLHHLNHECEAVLRHNGRLVTLRKVYSEKYTRKRGSAKEEFTGHTVEHFLDGVPVPMKDYTAFIASMIEEEIFKLLTSPTYFNNNLHWEKRRKLLLDVCGDISDEDVIASDENLKKLPAILGGRTIDDHRKVITARRTKINAEIKEISPRIDEVTRTLPDITGIDENLLISEIEGLKSRTQEKRNELSRVQSGGQVAEKTKALRQIEAKLLDIQNKQHAETLGKAQTKRTELNNIRGQISTIEQDIQLKQGRITRNDTEITRLRAEAQRLREQYGEINKTAFAHDDQLTCPTCKQSLPEEQVNTARQKALADFNLLKSDKLEKINAAGKGIMGEVAKLVATNEELEKQIALLDNQLPELHKTAGTLQNEIDSIGPGEPSQEYAAAFEEKEALQKEISALSADSQDAITTVRTEITALETELTAKEKQFHQIDTYVAGQKRIDELKKQEKTLAAEYERLESELYLTESFIRAKVNLLEERINSKFKLARFKMFSTLINGGIEECCETIYDGVPYSSGLNAGHKIIVGMDIIQTLSQHYGFSPVLFVDNAESVSELPEMDAQVIRLVKPEITPENREMYSKLVVQVEDENKLREAV
jgi:uncharacterized coiled-coil DUF342 family protein